VRILPRAFMVDGKSMVRDELVRAKTLAGEASH
jgi:hypothetical protein